MMIIVIMIVHVVYKILLLLLTNLSLWDYVCPFFNVDFFGYVRYVIIYIATILYFCICTFIFPLSSVGTLEFVSILIQGGGQF